MAEDYPEAAIFYNINTTNPERLSYVIETFSGASINAEIKLLGDDMALFNDTIYGKDTDKM